MLTWKHGYSAVSSSSCAGGGESIGTAGIKRLIPVHWDINRTFAIIAVGTSFAVIVSSVAVVLHVTVAVTIIRAARSVSAIIVAITAIIFARRIVTAAWGRGSCTSSGR
jgi:hypothetical protein